MTLLKKMKVKKIKSGIPNELHLIETLTKLQYCSEGATSIYCRVMLLALIRPLTLNHDRNLWNCRGAPDETARCLSVSQRH